MMAQCQERSLEVVPRWGGQDTKGYLAHRNSNKSRLDNYPRGANVHGIEATVELLASSNVPCIQQ